MRTGAVQDPMVAAAKRRLEMEILLLTSDQKKLERVVEALRAENRTLKTQQKRIEIDLTQNTTALRSKEVSLERLVLDIASKKKKMNTLR